MTSRLTIKDLVSIGIFSVIYIVLIFTVGMIGMIPLFIASYLAVVALVSGVVVMLFMARVPKKWALFIMATMPALLFTASGHTYVLLVHAIVFNAIGEFLFRAGNFKSFRYNALAYGFISCGLLGGPLQMLLVRERYLALLGQAASAEYLETLEQAITYPNMVILYVVTFAAGLVGAYIGKRMLKKHFEKAGIV